MFTFSGFLSSPIEKSIDLVCTSCKQAVKAREVSEEVSEMSKALKKSVRIPFYLYSGLIVFLIGIAAIIYTGNAAQDRYKEYIENPQANDIYTLHNKDEPTEYKYYLWKVTEVAGDSVYVSPNSFQYNYIPSKLEEEDGFFDVQFIMNKSDVRDLFEENVIKQVDRGFKAGSGFERQLEYTGEDSPDSN